MSTKLFAIKTKNAPKALGPYSQAIRAGDFIFCSGQIGIKSHDERKVIGDIKTQTEQVLKNLEAVLFASGVTLASVVKTDVFLQDMKDFSNMNEVYLKYFNQTQPARATIGVSKLPKDALIEISCIAVIN
jgi:2-iminobutanoate/2-iminopropanoate deaminase